MFTSRKYSKSVFGLVIFLFIMAAFALSTQAATFTVTKTADTNDGSCDIDCSLREALAAANAATTSDVVEFAPAVFATTQAITLNGSVLQIENNGTLTINGTGSNLLTISGNQTNAIFRIEAFATATINGIKITKGSRGAITNQLGNLTINNSIISENKTDVNGEGGGIYNCGGNVIISNSTISNNSAGSNGGGGIATGDDCVSGQSNSLTITDSIISNNTTTNNGGGIKSGSILNITNTVIINNSANFAGGMITARTTNLTNVTVTNNTAASNSGGIHGQGTLIINSSTINNNKASNSGGAMSFAEDSVITINNSTVSLNMASNSGGAINNFRGTVNFNNSIVSGNSAINGGGIYNDSLSNTMTLNNSTIVNNTASGDGGGVYNAGGTLTSVNSTVSGNSVAAIGREGGGGFYNAVATLNLNNSTVSGNSTSKQGGGVLNRGTLNLNYSTVSQNQSVTNGGGIFNFNTNRVNAQNTIIADNISANKIAADFSGILTSQGYNLVEDIGGTTITGVTTGNVIGQDAQLLPLRNNGGTTLTVGLQPNSPAIDAADPNNFPATDQRGISRPKNGDGIGTALADIGAFERDSALKTLFDFDGDGKADVSVYRPSNGVWYLLNSGTGFSAVQFGISTDKIVPADYDGDGKTDFAVFRFNSVRQSGRRSDACRL